MKGNIFTIILLLTAGLFSAISWSDSIESAREKALFDQSPLLIFVHSADRNSSDFNMLLDRGMLDFLQESFVFFKSDVSPGKDASILETYNPGYIPFFILEEHEPLRKDMISPVGIEPLHLFNALHEIYNYIYSQFISEGNFDAAYGALKLIEGLPDDFGIEVKAAMKRIEPNVKNRISVKQKNDDAAKAESYFQIAESSIESENFKKAAMYLEKVIELSPGSEISGKAKAELEKIRGL